MLLCHVHVCVELHGNFLLYLQSDVCNCLKQRAFYVLAISRQMDIVLDTQTEEAEMHRHPGNRYFCVLANKKKKH